MHTKEKHWDRKVDRYGFIYKDHDALPAVDGSCGLYRLSAEEPQRQADGAPYGALPPGQDAPAQQGRLVTNQATQARAACRG